jgi:hypothetical protein
MSKDVFRRAQRLARLPPVIAQTASYFQTGFDLGNFCRPNAFDGRKFACPRFIDSFKAAEPVEKLARMIANSSVSVSVSAPLSRSFSRGRSSAGQSLIVWLEVMVRLAVAGQLCILPKRTADSVYHNPGLSPIRAEQDP